MFRYHDMELLDYGNFQDEPACTSRRAFIKSGLAGISALVLLNGCASDTPTNLETIPVIPLTPDTIAETLVDISLTTVAPTSTSLLVETTVPATTELTPATELLQLVGQSLINRHEVAAGGWRYLSAIQAPHYQTDRDVGASSVGMGFLVAADQYPDDPKWLQAAEQTANWLMAVAHSDNNGGMFWPDYVDDNGTSSDIYTSFDDGALGIGDFFWQLYERTQDTRYKDVSLASLRWIFGRAENIGKTDSIYRWQYNTGGTTSEYFMGMGQGAVGQIHSFATYFERLQGSDPEVAAECQEYVSGSLRYIDKVRTALGNNSGDARAIPETGVRDEVGDTNMNSGYLSGAAGAAFMYLKLYKVFGDEKYLAEADKIFSWLEDTENGPIVNNEDGSVAWKLALDPQGVDNPILATGFEEGSAGIGWTYLQAYKITGNQRYLGIASQSADWLALVSVAGNNGIAWHEDEVPTNPIIHSNLNNGSAGVGVFLKDLSEAGGDSRYNVLAQQVLNRIISTSLRDINGNIYWADNGGEADYSNDPSWHWGTAGIMEFIAKMSGSALDIPGEQPGLSAD